MPTAKQKVRVVIDLSVYVNADHNEDRIREIVLNAARAAFPNNHKHSTYGGGGHLSNPQAFQAATNRREAQHLDPWKPRASLN